MPIERRDVARVPRGVRGLFVVRTEAGPLELALASTTKVAGPDGRPLGSAAELRAGQNVRVYYLVNHGAKAQEVDALP